MGTPVRALAIAAAATGVAGGAAAAAYLGLITGACPLDLGIGRRARPLGPQVLDIAASRDLVFDVIAQPYLGRPPAPWPRRCTCSTAAATWCWPPTAPRSAPYSAAG